MLEAESIVHGLASYISLILDAIAVLVVLFGSVVALLRLLPKIVKGRPGGTQVREIFIELARWLIAALTFQLGSDIVETTIAPTWDELGRLASVAVIRTFLAYFLDKDLEKARAEQRTNTND